MKASFLFRKGQTNVNALYSFVLLIVLVGMVIGVGVLTFDKFGETAYYKINDYNDTIAVSTLTNRSAVALDVGNITTVDAVWNNSVNILASVCYNINKTPGEFEFRNDTGTDNKCHELGTNIYVIYDYKDYNTVTKTALTDSRVELANIASDWIGLIVTVFILSIILVLVIMSFRPGMERS